MHKKGRALTVHSLLTGLLTLAVTTTRAQPPAQIDFQVIHTPEMCRSKVGNLAIRSQEEWVQLCQAQSHLPARPETSTLIMKLPMLPAKIDFARFTSKQSIRILTGQL